MMNRKPFLPRLLKLIVFSILVTGGPLTTNATETLVIQSGDERYMLGKFLEIFEDKTGSVTFDDIVSGRFDDGFVTSTNDMPNLGFTDAVFWIKFTVYLPKNNSRKENNWILYYDNPFVTELRFYSQDSEGRYLEKKSGDVYPFSHREIKNRNYAFKILINPGETKTFFLRHYDKSVSIIPLSLVTEDTHISYTQRDYLIYGMYFGIFFMIFVVNLVLFIIVRDKHYLLYAGFLFFSIILLALMYGFLNQFIWPDIIGEMLRFSGLITTAAGITGLLFAINFLNLKSDLPAVYKGLKIWALVLCVWALLSIFTSFQIMMNISILLSVLQGWFILGICVVQVKKGYAPARYYLVASIIGNLLGGFSILARNKVSIAGLNPDDLIKIGRLFTILVLSIAIEMKLRNTQKEKEAAEQLAIANLKKADHLKDMFLANTSHELRTPLHGMIGITESLMRTKKLEQDVKEDLALITSSSWRLASMVNDILDFSRIKADDLELNLKPVDLFATVTLSIRLIEPLTAGKQIEFVNLVNPQGRLVLADENRLKQILNNLLGNAAKFTESGYIKIEAVKEGADFKRDGNEQEKMEIRVSDTGIGIPEEKLGTIFNLFEQGEGELNRTYPGTGLGLTITKKLVEMHNGQIWAESVPGVGSSFVFTLPVLPLLPETGVSESSEEMASETDEPVQKSLIPDKTISLNADEMSEQLEGNPTVLLVDDDPINIKVLQRFFSLHQCQVDVARNGIAALEKVKSGDFDLILLDIMMPGMSGYEVCQRIRKTYTPLKLPVIMLTAKTLLSEVDEGFRAGANDYIQKPFIMSELIRRINNVLKLKDEDQAPYFTIGKKGETLLFIVNEVKYLSTSGKDAIIHTVEKEHKVRVMFKEIEKNLPKQFVRIHRQFIVNTDFIHRLSHIAGGRYKVILKDKSNTELVVSRTYISFLREQLNL